MATTKNGRRAKIVAWCEAKRKSPCVEITGAKPRHPSEGRNDRREREIERVKAKIAGRSAKSGRAPAKKAPEPQPEGKKGKKK